MSNWKTIKAEITRFLRTNPGKVVSNIHAEGAVVFNPADYCPYSDECLSFHSHSRGRSGNKGVHSHLRKVHPEITYFLVPCTLKQLVKYAEEHPGTVKNIIDGIKSRRLKFSPAESLPLKRLETETRLRTLFAARRHENHCKIFLHKTIPRSSRNINYNDIQTLVAGLKEVWSRSIPSRIGVSGKADATRARMHAIATLVNASKGEKSFATIATEVPDLRNPAHPI